MNGLAGIVDAMHDSEMQRVARRRRVRRVLLVGELVGKAAGYALLAKAAGLPTAVSFFLIIQAGELRAARKGL
jgi:hypothetical protein